MGSNPQSAPAVQPETRPIAQETSPPMSTTSNAPPKSAETNGRQRRLVRWLVPRPLPQPINPALVKHSEEEAQDAQNRVADKITTFAGSMTFVYIHVLWFG